MIFCPKNVQIDYIHPNLLSNGAEAQLFVPKNYGCFVHLTELMANFPLLVEEILLFNSEIFVNKFFKDWTIAKIEFFTRNNWTNNIRNDPALTVIFRCLIFINEWEKVFAIMHRLKHKLENNFQHFFRFNSHKQIEIPSIDRYTWKR